MASEAVDKRGLVIQTMLRRRVMAPALSQSNPLQAFSVFSRRTFVSIGNQDYLMSHLRQHDHLNPKQNIQTLVSGQLYDYRRFVNGKFSNYRYERRTSQRAFDFVEYVVGSLLDKKFEFIYYNNTNNSINVMLPPYRDNMTNYSDGSHVVVCFSMSYLYKKGLLDVNDDIKTSTSKFEDIVRSDLEYAIGAASCFPVDYDYYMRAKQTADKAKNAVP